MPLLKDYEDCFSVQETVGYVVKFSQGKDIQDECGSCGSIDAILYPLLNGYNANGRKTAAPVILIENTKGTFEGGRWIFINMATDRLFWNNGGSALLNKLAQYANHKAYDIGHS